MRRANISFTNTAASATLEPCLGLRSYGDTLDTALNWPGMNRRC